MRVVTCHQGRLLIGGPSALSTTTDTAAALPGLERGHVHELLAEDGVPRRVAAWLSQALASEALASQALASQALASEPGTAASGTVAAVVWCESAGEPYPPALAAAGVSPGRVYLVRPRTPAEGVWATVEALRCRGVAVTVAMPARLTKVEARRLQLAAERGGGIGLLLRRPGAAPHAARTRWLVRPALGDALTQRWRLRLIHGHGRPSDQDVLVEVDRETHHVRATAVVADRPNQTTPARTA